MQRDILCHLIQFQYNISQLNDEEFITFCAEMMRNLTRKEIESILFSGLNSMRLRGCRSSLKVKNIVSRGSNITFNIKMRSKINQNESQSQIMTLATINRMVQFQNLPHYLCNYLCDFLDIQSLLTLQLINRYFCVISRRHRNYSLLLIISPYNSLPTNRDYAYNTFLLPSINENEPLQQDINNEHHQSSRSQSPTTDNNNFLHSVNETALNSGYYKKFFIPIKKLGAGSYGSVFLVNHIMHGIYLGKFAMKIICVGDDLNRLIDILREVRTLQQLHHRNVIDYKHSWLENYQPAITGPSVPCSPILHYNII